MGTTVSPDLAPTPGVTSATPRLFVFVATALGGLLVAVLLVVLAQTNEGLDPADLWAFIACWLTVPYIVAGLIAWRRRPESRLGILMTATGFVTALGFANWSNNDFLYTIGVAAQFLPPAMYLHLFLSFPTGRLRTRWERGVVGAAYGAVVLSLLRLGFGQDFERNVVALTDSPEVVSRLRAIQLVVVSALLLTGTVLLVVRRLRSRRPVRPALGYLVDSFSVALVLIATLYLVQLAGWTDITDEIRLITFAMIGVAPVVFLIALLQSRLGRASVGDLVVAIGVNPGPADLQTAISAALHDPSARLVYWLPEFDSYADVEGHQVDLEELTGSGLSILRDGDTVAKLVYDPGLDDEPELLSAVKAAVELSIQNAQLQVELRARLEELRGSRIRILRAEQQERRRLERDLHDGAQQRLISLSLELGELSSQVNNDPALRARIERVRKEVTESLADLRDLAHGIHPAAVTDHGLAVALESVSTRCPVPVRLIGTDVDRLPEQVELAAFYIVSEALANVARHARATAAVVRLEREDARLVVEVVDDGVGGASADNGSGLRGLADRVEALGGLLQVWSPPGEGTRVRAEMPCG